MAFRLKVERERERERTREGEWVEVPAMKFIASPRVDRCSKGSWDKPSFFLYFYPSVMWPTQKRFSLQLPRARHHKDDQSCSRGYRTCLPCNGFYRYRFLSEASPLCLDWWPTLCAQNSLLDRQKLADRQNVPAVSLVSNEKALRTKRVCFTLKIDTITYSLHQTKTFWQNTENCHGKRDNREVLQHVILAKKPYERRLRGAAPILYVILVRKPRNERPRYGLST